MQNMKRYPENDNDITHELFTRYKIIVPTQEDKNELIQAFKLIHDSRDLDNNYVTVNQLMHEYHLDSTNIIVSEALFNDITGNR